MQFRSSRGFPIAGLLALGALAILAPRVAADAVVRNPMMEMELRTRAAKLRTQAPSDPDTVWIGHVVGNTGLPGTATGHGPHHIGRGLNRPNTAGVTTNNGFWDFDRLNAGETDSLQGWWPITCPFASVGGSNFPDRVRPFFGFDYGNQGNYVINQGNTAGKRTFGVTGYWHRDGGSSMPAVPHNSGHNPVTPTWAPLSGNASAWCGLRSHGDVAAQDAVANGGTGNWFNQSLLEYNGNNNGSQIGSTSQSGTDRNFPGYGSQWDQLLYRDVTLADGANLNISFQYRTNLAVGAITTPAQMTGWYDKDPIKDAEFADGNYVSASDAAVTNSVPIDSFMVYIGVPVDPVAGAANDFTASDGIVRDIYDVKRRWFSEVIAIDKPYRELLTRSGVNATQTFSINITGGGVSIVQQILDAQPGPGGKVRLAFRVKTNRGTDDEDNAVSTFSSGTAGAAIVDNVVVNAWPGADGDFEAANAINNDPAVAATSAWKSTGKPPGIFFHLHSVESGGGLPYDDPCGLITSPNRLCNLRGKIATPGDHDAAEKPGGLFGANDQDRQKFFASPTINLMSNGVGDYNGQGIDAEIADVSGDYDIFLDIYTALLNFTATGNGMRFAWQSYPACQPNGVKCWGEVTKTITFFHFGADAGPCFQLIGGGAKAAQLLKTCNPSGIPDSIRVYIEQLSRCYTQPELGPAECSPSSGPNAGLYYDNISVMLLDAASPPGLDVAVWDWLNDAFPTNSSPGFVGSPAFDTLAAQVRSGFNTSPGNGTLLRHNIPGDTALVTANGTSIRIDMVFRILPGVGNYTTIGNRSTALRKRPDAGGGAPNTVAPGDGSFWGTYQTDAGIYGTGGNGVTGAPHDPDGPAGPIVAGTRWDPNHWNSARIDSAEFNIFPCDGVASNASLAQRTIGKYASMYHEDETKRATLGIVKNRCFLIDNTPGSQTNSTNITCGNAPYPPAWTGSAGSGFNNAEHPSGPGRTLEYTKIIPDGQLTPGAHVQYFFRKSEIGDPVAFEMLPDTFTIWPNFDGNFDGHRWQEFGVLPDRWKDPAFGVGGTGMACMLAWDLGDRRADELVWVSTADSIGMTAPNKRGAHNGWAARGDQDITLGVNPASTPPGDPTLAVRAHIGQPGSMWDLFQVKAGESNVPAGRLGSRAASQQNPGLAAGKFSTAGPTGEMLRGHYRTLVLLAADLAFGSLGPFTDQTDDDIGLMQDFISNPSGGTTPRGVMAFGKDLLFGQDDATQGGHPTFFPTFFGATLRDNDYRVFSGNTNDAADLIPVAPTTTTPGSIYSVFNPCFFANDVLNANVVINGAALAEFYENAGGNGPYGAAVYTPEGGSRNARTWVAGWTYGFFGGMGSRYTLRTGGQRDHHFKLLTGVFGALTCAPSGTPIGIGDGPDAGSPFVNFLNLRSENPMRSGEARIAFGVTKTEKVEVKVYDVTGRLVKTIANRLFPGGQEHVVIWDGTNDAGHSVARGVYFYQLRSPSFVSQKKLAVLSN